MAILVSGGAGYIGSHTCIELLNAGFDIVVADNYYNASPVVLDRVKQITGKDFRFYQADMTKHEDVEKIFTECPDIDAVIQFAAYKAVAAFGIITGEFSGFLKDAVRQFVVAGFYDDVGAGHSFGVKPPVVAGGKFKRQFLVLVIVLPDIDVISVGGTVVERFALNLGLLVGALPADIAVFDQFFLDLHEIVFRECNIE